MHTAIAVYCTPEQFIMPTPEESMPDERYMEALANGDKSALTPLYTRYSGKLMAYLYRMLGADRELAQDFCQEVFSKLLEKPHLYNPERPFGTWIFSLAANLCKNEYRRRQVRQNPEAVKAWELSIQPDTSQLDDIDLNSFMHHLSEALKDIDPVRRTTFLLRFQQGMSIKEIAEITETTEGTVKSRLFYLNRELAHKLKHVKPT